MEKIELSCCADLHLWPYPWKRYPEVNGDAYLAFQNIISRSKFVPLLIAGDIFHHGDQAVMSKELKWFAENINDRDQQTFVITGGHEHAGNFGGVPNPQWIDTLSCINPELNLVVVDNKVVKYKHGERTWTIGGISFCRGREAFSESLEAIKATLNTEGIDKLDILLCHQSMKELLNFEGAYQTTAAELQKVAWFTLIGDVHTSKVFTSKDGSTVCSPGSIIPTAWDQIDFVDGFSAVGGNGFYEVSLSAPSDEAVISGDKNIVKVETNRIPLPGRLYGDFRANDPKTEQKTLDALEACDITYELKPFIKIKYRAESTDFADSVKNVATRKGLIVDLIPVHVVFGKAPVKEDGTSIEKLRSIIDRHTGEDTVLKEAVISILKGQKPKEVIEEVVTRIMNAEKG